MIIGVPREIKDNENRVACTPGMARELVERGHEVVVETGAGSGSGFPDEEYVQAGAKVASSAQSVYETAEMVIKVKEPLPQEYALLRRGQILFTYLHLAANKELTENLMRSGCIGFAYECVTSRNQRLPLLTPMSEVAGRMATHVGAFYLGRPQGGPGILLQGVPGVAPARVVIVGGGTVGLNAAKVAAGMGASVTLLEKDPDRIRYLDDILPRNVTVVMSSTHALVEALKTADLVVCAVLVPAARTPVLITRDMLSEMKPKSVIVDVAVDQGGCTETTRPTSHSDPTYYVDEILHYAVANMPGAFPQTSTISLTNSTLPYVLRLADLGPEEAMASDDGLASGLNVYKGHLTCAPVAQAHGLEYTPLGSPDLEHEIRYFDEYTHQES